VYVGEVWGSIGSNNGLATFTAMTGVRHIVVHPEFHEGCDFVEMATGWGRFSSLFPLRLEYGRFGIGHICSIADSDEGRFFCKVALGQRARY
jgi:hypothetical protein